MKFKTKVALLILIFGLAVPSEIQAKTIIKPKPCSTNPFAPPAKKCHKV